MEALADCEPSESDKPTNFVKRRAKQRYLEPSGGCKLKVKMDKEPDSIDGAASDARNQSDSKYAVSQTNPHRSGPERPITSWHFSFLAASCDINLN